MQTITAGAYKNFRYTYNPGTRVITVYDLFDVVLSFDALALLTLQRVNSSVPLYAPSLSLVNTITYSAPATAPVVPAATAGGSITAGTHGWAYSFVIGSSETLLSPVSNILTISAGTQTVSVPVPAGPSGTTSRNIYRYNANTTTFYLVGTISDNTTLTFVDTFADTTTTPAPTTSTAFDITYVTAPSLQAGDTLVIEVRNTDQTYDYNLNVEKTQEQSPAKLPLLGWQVGYISDSGLAVAANPYYRQILQNISAGWTKLNAFIKASCSTTSTTCKVFATSNPGVTVPTDGTALSSLSVDWVDVTAQIFKNDPAYVSANKNVVVPIAGTYTSQLNWSLTDLNGNEFVPDSFLVAITIGNATNTFQIDVNNY